MNKGYHIFNKINSKRNNMGEWQSTKYIWVNIYQSRGNQKTSPEVDGFRQHWGMTPFTHSFIRHICIEHLPLSHALPSLPGIQQ